MKYIDYDYAQQANRPQWLDGRRPIELEATSGTNPFNEWGSFNSREDALEIILLTAENYQQFVDKFTYDLGEIYLRDEFEKALSILGFTNKDDWSEFVEGHADEIKASIQPASLHEIWWAVSRF